VTDRRLPFCSRRMPSSSGWLRSSASGTRRVVRRWRMSTLSQRGFSGVALASN
jgi:hypothetical protein